jgi:hypothetical protein
VNCACANVGAGVLGALGGARDLGEDSITQKQELALRRCAWRHGEARIAAGTACRAWKRATGRSKAAVGHGVMHGIAGRQEVALGAAAVKRGLGRQRATWRGNEEPARGRGTVGQVLGWHVAERRATLGWQGRRTWPASAAAAARTEKQRRRERGR